MSRLPECVLLLAFSLAALPSLAQETRPAGYYGYGQAATAEQIAGWDIDVRPDGLGLPPGSGSVEDGEMLYEEQCAECHGSFGEGEGRYPSLAGGEDSLREERPHKTVGSYWKYTSTLWDYIHRAMPFARPESLTDDEVYAVTAYVLYLNELVEDDFVLSQQNLADVRLPNEANFTAEQRPDVENRRCMKQCRDPAEITIHSQAPQYEAPLMARVAVAEVAANPGMDVYNQSCAVCHDNGVGGAPVTGDASAWTNRVSAGMDTLYDHAINGFQGSEGVMPPKGGFVQLSDDAVRLAVDYMLGVGQ